MRDNEPVAVRRPSPALKSAASIRAMWLKFREADDAGALDAYGQTVMETLDWTLGYTASAGDIEYYLPELGTY